MALRRRKPVETVRVTGYVREGISWTRAGVLGVAFLMAAAFLGLVGAYGPHTKAPGGSWALGFVVLAPLFGFPFGWTGKCFWRTFKAFG